MPTGTSGPRGKASNDQLWGQEVKVQGQRSTINRFGGQAGVSFSTLLCRVAFLVRIFVKSHAMVSKMK